MLTIAGLPCLDVLEALLDEVRDRPLREAVVALDMTAAAGIVRLGEVEQVLARRSWRGVPGIPDARRALALADADSDSPQETRLRLIWQLDADLPRPKVNWRLISRTGQFLGYPDLLDLEAGLVAEYDGADHRGADRHSSDVDREALMREHGLEVTRLTGPDLRRTDLVVARLLRARKRARFEPRDRRQWLATPRQPLSHHHSVHQR